jgi:hypothetical protein
MHYLITTLLLIFSLTLHAVQKDDNFLNNSETLIKIDIKEINSFNFDSFKKEFHLNLKFCIGESICVFELTNNSLNQGVLEDIAHFGRVQIYKPYHFKTY